MIQDQAKDIEEWTRQYETLKEDSKEHQGGQTKLIEQLKEDIQKGLKEIEQLKLKLANSKNDTLRVKLDGEHSLSVAKKELTQVRKEWEKKYEDLEKKL